MEKAAPLLDHWLKLEGERRLLEALQARERERLRQSLLTERAEAFRRASGTPVAERLAFRKASKELSMVMAAEAEAERVERIVVQERVYTDGTVSLEFIDGTRDGSTVSGLVQPESQDLFLTDICAFVGESDDERIYVQTAERTTKQMEYSNGKVDESATRLVIGVRRDARGGGTSGLAPERILSEMAAAHGRGELAGLFRLTSDALVGLSVTMPTESVVDGRTIFDFKVEADEAKASASERLAELAEKKANARPQLRAQKSVEGAMDSWHRQQRRSDGG
jgi:urease gamma subunit